MEFFRRGRPETPRPVEPREPLKPEKVSNIIQCFLDYENPFLEGLTGRNPIEQLELVDFLLLDFQLENFLRKLSNNQFRDISDRFFTDIVRDPSPVAQSAEKHARNLQEISADRKLTEVWARLNANGNLSIHPDNIRAERQNILQDAQRLGPTATREAEANFQRFLKLYFGKKPLEYSYQFMNLQQMAWKRFGYKRPRVDDPQLGGRESLFDFEDFLYGHATSQSSHQAPPPPKEAKKPHAIDPDPKGYYRALGLDPAEMRGLPPEEYALRLKKAYREAAKASHTDVGGNREAIVAVNLANDFLSNPFNRQNYGI